jgi:tRNA (guanine37-N1)-methyltransferase
MSAPLATFEVVTLFPELFSSFLSASLLGKAIERGLLAVHFTDPRTWGLGRHRAVDDAPYGGGGGMILRVDPLVAALEHIERERGPAHKVLLGPAGGRLDRAAVERLCRLPRLVLLCGRYEGFDERITAHVDEQLSLGDFVLSGGEVAAMAVIDACARRLPGVLGNDASAVRESFEEMLLEHPQYTRPPDFRGAVVPEVLQSGDHRRIERWRRQQALLRTRARRPDLFARHPLTEEDRALLAAAGSDEQSSDPGPAAPPTSPLCARTAVALCHHPVLDRAGAIITTAVTNLDIHDLSRSSRTYDLGATFLVTPIEAQRQLIAAILDEWRREGADRNDHRQEALGRARVVATIDEAVAAVEARFGRRPLLVATSARPHARSISYPALRAQAEVDPRPLLILFGTGWGLAEGVVDRVDRVLAPIQGAAEYNHLSVRSAAAIVLDRLFGECT